MFDMTVKSCCAKTIVEIIQKLSTPRDSQAVPQPSTNLALSCLASEFGWDLALSAQYGRQLILIGYWFQTCGRIEGAVAQGV